MNPKLILIKISTLTVLYFGYDNLVHAQKDTIPPVISKCNDTVKVQLGTVWVEQPYTITDNQSDSANINVVRTWGNNGPVNSTVRGIHSRGVEATDSNGNTTKCNIYYKVDDFIGPLISLNTEDTVCHVVGTPYNPVQPTATDNFYPNSQISLVRLSSSVNPNVLGTYEEHYQAIDGSGNKTTKTRYVIVSTQCAGANINNLLLARLNIFPNPSKGFVTINLTNTNEKGTLKIISLDGKSVFESPITDQVKIDVRGIPDGIYVIQVVKGNMVFNRKLIVQH